MDTQEPMQALAQALAEIDIAAIKEEKKDNKITSYLTGCLLVISAVLVIALLCAFSGK